MPSIRSAGLVLVVTLAVLVIGIGSILVFATLGLYWSSVLVVVLLVLLYLIKYGERQSTREDVADGPDEEVGTSPERDG